RIMRGGGHVGAPGKRAMIGDKNSGDRVSAAVAKSTNDCVAGVLFILAGNFILRHRIRHRDRSVEVIGMRGAETWDLATRLGPGSGVFGVGMDDAANVSERFVKDQMRGQIRRRT